MSESLATSLDWVVRVVAGVVLLAVAEFHTGCMSTNKSGSGMSIEDKAA